MRSIGYPELLTLLGLPFVLGYFILIVFLIVKFFQMASDIRAMRRILTDSPRHQPSAQPSAGTG